jgi:SnoaL-like domain
MPYSSQDRTEITDLLARYSWLVDEGEGDAWADLWTADGSFTGIPDPLHGREALRQMPPGFHQGFGGRLRHHITNILLRPGENADEALVKAYSTVSDWRDGGKLLAFAKVNFTLQRQASAWKIKALRAEMF